MTFMDGDPETECYGDNCKKCSSYDRCGYIRISNPFHDKPKDDEES